MLRSIQRNLFHLFAAAVLVVAIAATQRAQAMDGAGIAGATYYEGVVGTASAEALASPAPGVPTRVTISDSTATATYAQVAVDVDAVEWVLRIRGLDRSHERTDALYQMIAVLPLPVDTSGRWAFQSKRRAIVPREGVEGASVPLIYGGEKIRLKRDITLEKTLLPGLIGGSSDQIPDLAGSGYNYTLWSTIVRYDASYGDTVQIFADVPFSTDDSVAPPDAADDRLKAYVITWIPEMDSAVSPFAIRMDIVAAD